MIPDMVTFLYEISYKGPSAMCWDLRLNKLYKVSTKIYTTLEYFESKYSTKLKYQE